MPDASAAGEWSIPDLTAAVADGDPDAFSYLYNRYFQALCNEARRVSRRDEAFCLDVVHDSMLRVLKRLGPLETEGQLIGWLMTVVRRCSYDLLRAEQRRRRREAAVARRAR